MPRPLRPLTVRRRWELATVSLALVAGLILLGTGAREPAPTGPATLASVWPDANPGQFPGRLADGVPYEPVLVRDPATTVAVAGTPDRQQIRLVQLTAGDPVQLIELRSLPARRQPRYLGTTTGEGWLVWAEATVADTGPALRIWTQPPGSDPVELTADTGAARFQHSQHDLVIADGQVHWVAVAPGGGTELRSVPLRGGRVTSRQLAGDWTLVGWPWLVTADVPAEQLTLRHVGSGRQVEVRVAADELVSCTAHWCRALVPASSTGPARIELRRPDGTDGRQLAPDHHPSSPLVDVALLNRYEVWTTPGPDGSPTSDQQLMLYDLTRDQSVRLSTGVGRVGYGNGFLWWSTGQLTTLRWHTLDLAALRSS